MDFPIKVAGDVGEAKGEADFWSKDERFGRVQRKLIIGTDHPGNPQPGVGKLAGNRISHTGVLSVIADECGGRRGDQLLLLGEVFGDKNPNFRPQPNCQRHIVDWPPSQQNFAANHSQRGIKAVLADAAGGVVANNDWADMGIGSLRCGKGVQAGAGNQPELLVERKLEQCSNGVPHSGAAGEANVIQCHAVWRAGDSEELAAVDIQPQVPKQADAWLKALFGQFLFWRFCAAWFLLPKRWQRQQGPQKQQAEKKPGEATYHGHSE